MAQTKAKPKKAMGHANAVDPSVVEVLTLAEAAAYLRVAEAEVVKLVQTQDLPGRFLGSEWRFLKSALQDWLRAPMKKGSWEAFLSVGGSMKDDPFLLDELEEIYKRRREDLIGDGE